MGFGTFDGIHPGHINFFHQLRLLGDKLCIVVARDKNVEQIKCKPPKKKELSRMKSLQELNKIKLIDTIILGDLHNFYQCIVDHKPDVIGLGYDQKADLKTLRSKFPNIKVIRLEAFKPEIHKSSLLSGNRTQNTEHS